MRNFLLGWKRLCLWHGILMFILNWFTHPDNFTIISDMRLHNNLRAMLNYALSLLTYQTITDRRVWKDLFRCSKRNSQSHMSTFFSNQIFYLCKRFTFVPSTTTTTNTHLKPQNCNSVYWKYFSFRFTKEEAQLSLLARHSFWSMQSPLSLLTNPQSQMHRRTHIGGHGM